MKPPFAIDRLIVIADLGGGGAQKVAVSLANAWADAGLKVLVLTFADSSADRHLLRPAVQRWILGGLEESRGLFQRLTRNSVRIVRLRRAIRRARPRQVISFVAVMNILTILATRGLQMEVIISERNDPSRQKLGRIWDLLRVWVYRFADRVTANTQQALESLAAYVPAHKLVLTPNWIEAPSSVAAAREPLLLSIGRLHGQKGFDVLLRAFAQSQARARNWKLAILGEGDEEAKLKSLSQSLGLEGQVEWAGYASDTGSWYLRASAFVLASRYEGLPNVVLEAAARASPLIVTDACKGCLEFLEHETSCLVTPSEDPKRLAAAIDRIVLDPAQAEKMGRKAREIVQHRFGMQTVLKDWEKAILPA